MFCVNRPVSYDGVIEPGKAQSGMSITQRGEINVDTLGTPSKRSSLERWGSGSGEVENVMRRASMDVDEDPGRPPPRSPAVKQLRPHRSVPGSIPPWVVRTETETE